MPTAVRSATVLKAKLFRGFSDMSRLSILEALRNGPHTRGDGRRRRERCPGPGNRHRGYCDGAGGTDVALETADVALMADDLSTLPLAVGPGRASRRVILQNLVIAFGVIAILIPAVLFGIASIGSAIVLHEGSTLVVVANALRLLGYTPRSSPRTCPRYQDAGDSRIPLEPEELSYDLPYA